MNGANWFKWKQNRGPDIWEYKSEMQTCNPGIAILKKEDKVIAKFIGPKNLSDRKIINHIRTVYPTEERLILFRISPPPKKDVVIKCRVPR